MLGLCLPPQPDSHLPHHTVGSLRQGWNSSDWELLGQGCLPHPSEGTLMAEAGLPLSD